MAFEIMHNTGRNISCGAARYHSSSAMLRLRKNVQRIIGSEVVLVQMDEQAVPIKLRIMPCTPDMSYARRVSSGYIRATFLRKFCPTNANFDLESQDGHCVVLSLRNGVK